MNYKLLSILLSSAAAASAAPLTNLVWTLPSTARIEGDVLVVDVPPGDPETGAEAHAHCRAELDLSDILGEGNGAAVSVRLRARDVTKPDAPWNGVKAMLHYVEEGTGEKQWPGVKFPIGTFDWTNATVRVNRLAAPVPPAGGKATLILGLQGCTGHVEFDLSTLDLAAEDLGVRRVNQDWIVRYPEAPRSGAMTGAASQQMTGAPAAQMKGAALQQMTSAPAAQMNDDPSFAGGAGTLHSAEGGPSFAGGAGTLHFREADPSLHAVAQRRTPLRGCMLPGRATTEDDIETLHRWGATMARFQIMRNWFMDNDCRDLEEYAQWIDSRLDNLEDVLRWAEARGMKICVDLHSPPGGKRPGDRTMNMFFEEKYADAFVETWKRIAARFKGHPAIYGYDLVNEPVQKMPAPFDYWELQRRAAEAVRAIDPDTPIVVESNLSAAPSAFRYLSPLAMDNVIYQIHVYKPHDYTHQGIKGTPLGAVWPDPARGRDVELLRRTLEPVRAFQKRHRARIYVGEFSAASYAPGAERYLRDCISLFEEYGWDWTYHAFREADVWNVEKARNAAGKYAPAADTPRKRALLDGFAGRIPAAPTAGLSVAAAEPDVQEVQTPVPELAPLTNLVWRLPAKYAKLDGDRLVVDIPAEAYPASAVAKAELPAALFAGTEGFAISVAAEGSALAKPTKSYLGLKFQMHWKENATGTEAWPNCRNAIGDLPATTLRTETSFGGAHPDSITLELGLQETSGRVVFDLSTLRGAASHGLFRRINEDYVVRYPATPCAANEGAPQSGAMTGAPAAQMKGASSQQMKGTPAAQMHADPSFAGAAGTLHSAEGGPSFAGEAGTRHFREADPSSHDAAPRRGVMLPQRDPTEEDFATLAEWGATLVRYQIMRNWSAVGDNRDLPEFAAWIDGKLDCLEKVVLPCARKYGIQVVVDLHVTPGGRTEDREMAMFREKEYADAFVETWRRIATRLKGNADAIYGYDLVNEPVQIGRAPYDYWTLQRRAAEAVREIDPDTAIIIESNDWDSPSGFAYLSPLRMDNVIYQVHCYRPMQFTHQGVHGSPVGAVWPDPSQGWDRDFIRRTFEPVRAFQKRHGAKIYVGEFSAIAWAQGADAYLRDCIAVFEEFGWDWSYHAFREWSGWSVEHSCEGPGKPFVPSADNPRKRALLDGFAGREP